MQRLLEQVPARHQRRVIVRGEVTAIGNWQNQYPGSVFVCISESVNDESAVHSVRAWIWHGASCHWVTFFAASSLGALCGAQDDTLAILVVGATDAVGFPACAVEAAAAKATTINNRLGRSELAVPRAIEAATELATPGYGENLSVQDAAALLAEGERRIRTEWEQRSEFLEPACAR